MNIKMITSEGIECNGIVNGFIAVSNPMKFDIMVEGRYNGQLTFPCCIGLEYSYNDLESFCRLTRPSLSKKKFELFPAGKPKFRN